MSKKLVLSIIGCSIISVCVAIVSLQKYETMSNADTTSYGMGMSVIKNQLHQNETATSGTSTLYTNRGGEVDFEYSGVNYDKNLWHSISPGGYFFTVNPIHGIENIYLVANNASPSYKIYYSGDEIDEKSKYEAVSQNTINFDFNEEYPNYIKIENTGTTNLEISLIELTYTCTNHYVSLKVSSADDIAGSVQDDSGSKLPDSSVTVTANPNEGYNFEGWYDGDSKISDQNPYTFTMPHNDLSLVARFTYGTYELIVKSESSSEGSVSSEVSGSYVYLTEITVSATSNTNYTFAGWHDGTDLVSNNNPYTFKMAGKNLTLTAIFWDNDEKSEWEISRGVVPSTKSDNTFTYGLYPQTHLSDEYLINKLNNSSPSNLNGWYFYNYDYYAKQVATPKYDGTFDDNTSIITGETYWFKCEPIIWQKLVYEESKYYLLSSLILDAYHFYSSNGERQIDGKTIYANNYEYSDIRAWLNNDFYNTAFKLNNTPILTDMVDNSASTTTNPEEGTNPYVCNNTYDKVFLPSYVDYINEEYGFPIDRESMHYTRQCMTTDYSRAIGVSFYHYEDQPYYINRGDYWTRSPSDSYSHIPWSIQYHGAILGMNYANNSGCGVRPAIMIGV